MLLAMAKKIYKASWAKIGNSSGYRLSAGFFKEHAQFVESDGVVEVINDNTLLFRRQSKKQEEDDEDELMLSLFLDFLMKQALANLDEVEAYTEAMAAEDEELIAGVEIGGH
jgi:antitoxin PrlF